MNTCEISKYDWFDIARHYRESVAALHRIAEAVGITAGEGQVRQWGWLRVNVEAAAWQLRELSPTRADAWMPRPAPDGPEAWYRGLADPPRRPGRIAGDARPNRRRPLSREEWTTMAAD